MITSFLDDFEFYEINRINQQKDKVGYSRLTLNSLSLDNYNDNFIIESLSKQINKEKEFPDTGMFKKMLDEQNNDSSFCITSNNKTFKNINNNYDNIVINIINKKSKKKAIKKGRIKKDSNRKGKHTKKCSDNLENKVKTFLFSQINDIINEAIIEKTHKLKKISYKNYKKITNIEFSDSTIKDLYKKNFAYPYVRKFSKNTQKALNYLDDINNRQKEKIAIDLLNLKGKDLFNVIIRDKDKVKEFATKKNKRENEEDEEYIAAKKEALYNFIDKKRKIRNKLKIVL